MKRTGLGSLLLVIAFTATATLASAQAAPEFERSFKTLADRIPDVAGQPVENDYWGANGDRVQRTSTGLMVWREADNWAAFTDGSTTWVLGPFGVMARANEDRFEWEAPGKEAEDARERMLRNVSRAVDAVPSLYPIGRLDVVYVSREDEALFVNQEVPEADWIAIVQLPDAVIQAYLSALLDELHAALPEARYVFVILWFQAATDRDPDWLPGEWVDYRNGFWRCYYPGASAAWHEDSKAYSGVYDAGWRETYEQWPAHIW